MMLLASSLSLVALSPVFCSTQWWMFCFLQDLLCRSFRPKGSCCWLLLNPTQINSTRLSRTLHNTQVRAQKIASMLSAQYWVPSTQDSVVATQCSALSDQHSALTAHYSVLSTQCWALSTQCSLLSARCSELSTQHSVLTNQWSLLDALY